MEHPTPIETLDVDILIQDTLSQLRRAFHADIAAWVSVGQVNRQHVVRHAHLISGDPLPFDPKLLVGRPFWGGSVFDDHPDLLRHRRGSWSITSPLQHHVNRFSVLDEDYLTTQLQRIYRDGETLSIYHSFYGPLEIYNQLRALVYQGSRALGWLGVCRRGARARFRASERAALTRQVSALVAKLSLVESQSSYGEVDDLEHLLLDRTLRVSWATAAAAAWMTPRRLDQVRACIRASGQQTHRHLYIDGVWVVVVTMALPSHGQEHLVTLEPTRSIRLSPLHGLEPQAVEAAQLLVRGFSVSQISRHLGISERQARAHMRRLARRFDAPDLVQLAARVAAALHLHPTPVADEPRVSPPHEL